MSGGFMRKFGKKSMFAQLVAPGMPIPLDGLGQDEDELSGGFMKKKAKEAPELPEGEAAEAAQAATSTAIIDAPVTFPGGQARPASEVELDRPIFVTRHNEGLDGTDYQNDAVVRLRSGRYVRLADVMDNEDLSQVRSLGSPGDLERQYPSLGWLSFWAGLLAVGTGVGMLVDYSKGKREKFGKSAVNNIPYGAVAPVLGAFFVHVAPRLIGGSLSLVNVPRQPATPALVEIAPPASAA